MSKPHIHAENSAKQFGGQPKDYIEIHKFLDSSKGVMADHRHRALTHNTWFISNVLERVFGYSLINSDGKEVSVRDVGEQHVLEDFRGKFIPSAQDWLEEMAYPDWMRNGEAEKPARKRSIPVESPAMDLPKPSNPFPPDSFPPFQPTKPQLPPREFDDGRKPWPGHGGSQIID